MTNTITFDSIGFSNAPAFQHSGLLAHPLNKARFNLHMARYCFMGKHIREGNRSIAMKQFNDAKWKLHHLLYGKAKTYTPDIETHVLGFPCGVVVTMYEPSQPATFDNPSEGDSSWFLVNERGQPIPFLERKMLDADKERIERLIEKNWRYNDAP